MIRIKYFLSSLLTIFWLSSDAQLSYRPLDSVYVPYIKSVAFHAIQGYDQEPIIPLQGGQLTLYFDDISDEDRNLHYRIIHCDRYWQKSDISEMDYLEGFNDEEIDDIFISQNTAVPYVHYKLILPRPETNWRISGNYILIIYDDDTEEVLITRRFVVYENQTSPVTNFIQGSRSLDGQSSQQFEVEAHLRKLKIANTRTELGLNVYKNSSWREAIIDVKPQFAVGNVAHFNIAKRISFASGQEYRIMDISQFRIRGYDVKSIEYDDIDRIILEPDSRRHIRDNFLDQPDFNGHSVFYRDHLGHYSKVYFSLLDGNPPLDQEVYVIGDFSDWQCREAFKMKYSTAIQGYYLETLLKQGFYDYAYVVRDQSGKEDMTYYEGNNHRTSNEYHFLLYYKPFGGLYDRVIGYAKTVTNPR